MSKLLVGTATVDITPPTGMPMVGNFRDDYAARGKHDPLCAKAVVFAEPGGIKAARVVLDLCFIDGNNVAVMRQYIADHCDVPPQNVMIGATHTHSGPATSPWLDFDFDLDNMRPQVETILTKAASSVVLANEKLVPADLAVGRSSEDRVSFNRRLRRKDGSTQMNWEALSPDFDPDEIDAPWGTVDYEMLCLTIERDGQPAAASVNFALHPAILAGDNWLYSADFPGYVAESMQKTLGEDFFCQYINGCCGNVNHIDYKDSNQGRGFNMTQRVGYMLGAAAHQAVAKRKPVSSTPLAVATDLVCLEHAKITDEQLDWSKKVLDEAARNPPKGLVDGLPDAYYAKTYLSMFEKQDQPDQVEVMSIRIGEVALVGLPGEIFCEFGIDIKRRSPAAYTLIGELCGDSIGYVPTKESFVQGGYEPMTGTTLYEEEAGNKLTEAVMSQLQRLYSE
ncbi:MAG: neutral/alkaline non-lysosomal ceramidase N-terminal domain-containing protein [Pirellulales bacterium]|nr:neutral/alkaline non-lysosomal ceramidase N-terminal domain-containing protein [Pirellulales bacterium]